MGLWLKQDDGSLVPVGGGGSGGGGDAGPHDHDYLPLEGGTLTGALTVDKSLTLNSETSNPLMVVNTGGTRVGYFGVPGAQAGIDGELWLRGDKALILQGVDGVHVQQCDLQVDGTITARVGGSADDPSYGFADMPGAGMFAHKANNWLRFAVAGEPQMRIDTAKVSVWKDLQVDGQAVVEQNLVARGSINFKNALVGTSASRHLWMNSNGWVCVTDTTRGGPFAPSKLARNSDVLERAETATLPPEPETDADGNQTNTAEVEAHDTVELFDVVTALLAKVKELSARIETLEGV